MLLIKHLQEFGYHLSLQGEDLKLTWAGQGKPDPGAAKLLLEEAKGRKAEIVAHLKNQVVDFQEEAAKVRAAIRKHGKAKVHSRVLGEVVIFALNEDAAAQIEHKNGLTVYTLAELRELSGGGLTKEDLRRLHTAKKLFRGEFIEGGGAVDPDKKKDA